MFNANYHFKKRLVDKTRMYEAGEGWREGGVERGGPK